MQITYQNANGLGIDGALQAAGVDALRVVAQPVAKVHALHEHGSPLLAPEEGDGRQHVLNVAMSEVVALDLFVPVRSLSLTLSQSLALSRAAAGRRTWAMDGMLPAPKAAAGAGRKTSATRRARSQEPLWPKSSIAMVSRVVWFARCGFVEVSCEVLRGGWTWRGFCAFFVRCSYAALASPVSGT